MVRSVKGTVLVAAVIALVVWAIVLSARWQPGWSALTWDDFTRVALAQRWAARPFLAGSDTVWLPLQTWVYGIGFAVTGARFADNPMLLAAVINSVATAATAALAARTAWLLFGSPTGALLALTAVLFAPWAVFTALSGLAEPLYSLAIATATWALASLQNRRRLGPLVIGSLGVAVAATARYEGWLLVPAWTAIVALVLVPWDEPPTLSRLAGAWWRARAFIVVAVAPWLVPLAWMALNAWRHGKALAFRDTTAAMFEHAYGTNVFVTFGDQLAYYPTGMLRSAPLLLPLVVALAIVGARQLPRSRPLVGLVTLHFGLFYVLSLSSGSVGAFTERFMFAFVLALVPLLGMVPGLIADVRIRAARLSLAAVVGGLLIAETAYGLTHPPEQWTHAPDLLEVGTLLGDLARERARPLNVLVGEGFANDLLPLTVQNGRRLVVAPAPRDPADRLPPGADVWIEKWPARIRALPLEPAAVVGRYYIYGLLTPTTAGPTLGAWRRVDEDGVATTVRPRGFVGLEFTADNPRPGAEAVVQRLVPRRERSQRGALTLRWMYGHGFNRGRLALEVRVDGRAVFRTDIAAPNRWRTVTFEIPAGRGSSTVALAVHAGEGIETTWLWGRSSTVVARDVVIAPD